MLATHVQLVQLPPHASLQHNLELASSFCVFFSPDEWKTFVSVGEQHTNRCLPAGRDAGWSRHRPFFPRRCHPSLDGDAQQADPEREADEPV